MKVIYKYAMLIGEAVSFKFQPSSKIVRFAPQNNALFIWVEQNVSNEKPFFERRLIVVGTGHVYDHRFEHLLSCEQGPFIWHLLELK